MSGRSSSEKSSESPKSEEHSPPATSNEDSCLVTIPDVPSPAISSIHEITLDVESIAQVTSATSLDASQESPLSTENRANSELAQTAEAQRAEEDAAEARRLGLQASFTGRVQHWNLIPRPENSNQEIQGLSPRRSPLGDLTRFHRGLAQNSSDLDVHQWTQFGPLRGDDRPSSSSVMPTSSVLTASRTSPDSSLEPLMRCTEEPSSETFPMVDPTDVDASIETSVGSSTPTKDSSFGPWPDSEPNGSNQSMDVQYNRTLQEDDFDKEDENADQNDDVDSDSEYEDELVASNNTSPTQGSSHSDPIDDTASIEISVGSSISTRDSSSGTWPDSDPNGSDQSMDVQYNRSPQEGDFDEEEADADQSEVDSDSKHEDELVFLNRTPSTQGYSQSASNPSDSIGPVAVVDHSLTGAPLILHQRESNGSTSLRTTRFNPASIDTLDPAHDAFAEDNSVTGVSPLKRRRESDISQLSSSLRTTESSATSRSGFELVSTSESKSSSSMDRDSTHPTEEHSTGDSEGGIPIVSDDHVSDEEYSFDPEDVLGHREGAAVEPRRVVDAERQALIEQRWEDMGTVEERSPAVSALVETASSEGNVSTEDLSNNRTTDNSSRSQLSQRTTSTSRSASSVPATAQEASEEPNKSTEKTIKAPATQAPAAKRKPKRK